MTSIYGLEGKEIPSGAPAGPYSTMSVSLTFREAEMTLKGDYSSVLSAAVILAPKVINSVKPGTISSAPTSFPGSQVPIASGEDKLKLEDDRIIIDRAWRGFSQRDIADELGVTRDVVRHRMSKLREKGLLL